jgi:hypothetical protein
MGPLSRVVPTKVNREQKITLGIDHVLIRVCIAHEDVRLIAFVGGKWSLQRIHLLVQMETEPEAGVDDLIWVKLKSSSTGTLATAVVQQRNANPQEVRGNRFNECPELTTRQTG